MKLTVTSYKNGKEIGVTHDVLIPDRSPVGDLLTQGTLVKSVRVEFDEGQELKYERSQDEVDLSAGNS